MHSGFYCTIHCFFLLSCTSLIFSLHGVWVALQHVQQRKFLFDYKNYLYFFKRNSTLSSFVTNVCNTYPYYHSSFPNHFINNSSISACSRILKFQKSTISLGFNRLSLLTGFFNCCLINCHTLHLNNTNGLKCTLTFY